MYGFVAYFRHFYFVISTSYHDIAVINLSERALHHLFLLSDLFTWSYKLVCGCLPASWLITGLYSKEWYFTRLFEYSVNIPGEYSNTKNHYSFAMHIYATYIEEMLVKHRLSARSTPLHVKFYWHERVFKNDTSNS